jgi:tetratricopeptide (TPR) repeat protein
MLCGGVIVFGALAAYANSFSGPFVFDDNPAIPQNSTIRHFWSAWSPPARLTVEGRPIINLSLALNYALGGLNVPGYHALNLCIHILAGLGLFGIIRRSFLLPVLREEFGAVALPMAFTAALIWTVHPLQTESVTYIIQRAESLMSLFYLLTLYCFIRGVESGSRQLGLQGQEPRSTPAPNSQLSALSFRRPVLRGLDEGGWFAASILCCLIGMGCKENMVSAPLVVFLYDRTFVTGSFREAWRQRRWFYGCLAGTWLGLGLLEVAMGGKRGEVAGFGTSIPWWTFVSTTQFQAVAHYLWLAVWPHPLVFEYGTNWNHPGPVLPYAVVVTALIAGTFIAWWRWPALGFLGVFFFAILAPTSLVPGETQVMVEHRMYLPLAAVVIAIVTGAFARAGPRIIVLFMALSIALGFLTWRRNQDYRTAESIWADTVAKRPMNSVARHELARTYYIAGRLAEAIGQYQEALRISPADIDARDALEGALFKSGRVAECLQQCEADVRLWPDHADIHNNLGNALVAAGRRPEALEQYKEAVRLKPDHPEAQYNLGKLLALSGDVPAGLGHFAEAVRLQPDYVEARYNLAYALTLLNRKPEAIAQYETAIKLQTDYADARYNLGVLLAQQGRFDEAREQFEEILRLKPDYGAARAGLARLQTLQPSSPPAK